MNIGMISDMKTAISLDEALLRDVDRVAQSMGLSRSRIFALAATEFLQRQQQEQMLRQLNEVYAEGVQPTERRLLKGMKAKFHRAVKKHR